MSNELFILVAEGPDKPWIKKDAGITDWLKEKKEELGRGTSRLKEFVNVPKHLSEMVFSPYSEQMGNLREVDQQIYFWTKSLWRLVSNAKSAFTKGRWMDSIFWLSQINKNLKGAVDAAKPVKELEQKQLEEFYGESEQPMLPDYFGKPGWLPEEASADDALLAEAGILDHLTPRAFTRRKLERMYRHRLQLQKRMLKHLLDSATATVDSVKGYVSDLASARASGDVSTYISLVNKISSAQSNFEKKFRETYDKHFAEMAERLRSKPSPEAPDEEKPALKSPSPEEAPKEQSPEEPFPLVTPKATPPEPKQLMPSLELNFPEKKPEEGPVVTPAPTPTAALPPAQPVAQPVAPAPLPPEGVVTNEGFQESDMPSAAPVASAKPKRQRGSGGKFAPRKQTASEVDQAMLKVAHIQFLNEFAKIAMTDNVGLMVMALCDYSDKIEDIDEEKSAALLEIAQELLSNV